VAVHSQQGRNAPFVVSAEHGTTVMCASFGTTILKKASTTVMIVVYVEWVKVWAKTFSTAK
jgi:hypothetical protein